MNVIFPNDEMNDSIQSVNDILNFHSSSINDHTYRTLNVAFPRALPSAENGKQGKSPYYTSNSHFQYATSNLCVYNFVVFRTIVERENQRNLHT